MWREKGVRTCSILLDPYPEKQSITNHIISILDDSLDKKEVGMIGVSYIPFLPLTMYPPSTFFAVVKHQAELIQISDL